MLLGQRTTTEFAKFVLLDIENCIRKEERKKGIRSSFSSFFHK